MGQKIRLAKFVRFFFLSIISNDFDLYRTRHTYNTSMKYSVLRLANNYNLTDRKIQFTQNVLFNFQREKTFLFLFFPIIDIYHSPFQFLFFIVIFLFLNTILRHCMTLWSLYMKAYIFFFLNL